jgi:hypothetical protein
MMTWRSKFETGLPLGYDIRKYPRIAAWFTMIYGELIKEGDTLSHVLRLASLELFSECSFSVCFI